MRNFFSLALFFALSATATAHNKVDKTGFQALVPAVLKQIAYGAPQQCDAKTCAAGQTCCNGVNGPSCCLAEGACCCPDQRNCCAPVNNVTLACVCYGTCPSESCVCLGCENQGWNDGYCTNK